MPEVAVVEPELGTGHMIARVLTNFNGLFHDQVKLSEPEEVWLDSTDGAKVHCWVMKPIAHEPATGYGTSTARLKLLLPVESTASSTCFMRP